ncbi:MAG: DUF669 domain-containing protein [Oscillospiraceae bacterium]
MTSFDFSELDSSYQKSSGSQSNVPDGRYMVVIKECKLRESKVGTPLLSWSLIVTQGECKGRYIFKNNGIAQNTLDFLKADIMAAGVDIKKLSELEGNLHQFANRLLEVSVTTKAGSDFANIYINKYVGMGDAQQFVKKQEDTEQSPLAGFQGVAGVANDDGDYPFY